MASDRSLGDRERAVDVELATPVTRMSGKDRSSESRGDAEHRVDRILAEYLEKRAAGERVEADELYLAHPSVEADLRRLLPVLDSLAGDFGRRADVAFEEDPPARRERTLTIGETHAAADPGITLESRPSVTDSDSTRRLLDALGSEGLRSLRYSLLDEIGRGGMGIVMRVWDEELRRTSAMKLVRGSAQDGETPGDSRRLGRFLAEAQVTGQLQHPGIVPVHELGIAADGQVYFTMQLVRGSDLRRVLELARREAEGWNRTRVLSVLLKVCEAMSYAHDKRVVHRDLKPANIMVGRYGEVYVMDWGLARVRSRDELCSDPAASGAIRSLGSQERGSSSPFETRRGEVLGTPAYMSPEQAMGDPERLGPASDIYSFGAMLYELLAGAPPHCDGSSKADAREIIERVIAGPPPPISELASGQPEELIAICEKAMARAPQQRYESMSVLGDDLRAFLENRVVAAYRTGALVELRKWVQRNRGMALSLAAALVFLIAGLAASLIFSSRADAMRGVADARASEAETVASFLEQLFEDASPTHSLGKQISVGVLLEQGRRRIERELGDSPAIRARLLMRLARSYFWLGEFDSAEELYSAEQVARAEAAGPNDEDTILAGLNVASCMTNRHACEPADALLEELYARIQAGVGPQNRVMVEWLTRRCMLHAVASEIEPATSCAKRAVSLCRAHPEYGATLLADALSVSMHAHMLAGRFKAARAAIEEVLELYRVNLPAGDPRISMTLEKLATVLVDLQEREEAIQTIDAALAETERVCGPEHPHVSRALLVRAKILRTFGQVGLAEDSLRRALAIQEKTLSALHPWLPSTLNSLGTLLVFLERPREARELFERAIGILRQLHPDGHILLGSVLKNMAEAELALGARDEAERLAREGFEMMRSHGASDGDVGSALWTRAWISSESGRVAEAMPMLDEALELLRRGEDEWALGKALAMRARLACESGNGREAVTAAGEALTHMRSHGPIDHAFVADALHKLGWGLVISGETERGREALLESIEMYRRLPPRGHPWIVWPLRTLVWSMRSDARRALPYAEECLQNSRQTSAEWDPWLAIDIGNVAAGCSELGQGERAGELFGEAIRLDRARKAGTQYHLARMLYGLARLELDMQRQDVALGHAQEAVRLLETVPPNLSYDRVSALGVLGRIESRLADYESAERHVLEALDAAEREFGEGDELWTICRKVAAELYEAWGRPEQAASFRD